jgi:hypothetical protein
VVYGYGLGFYTGLLIYYVCIVGLMLLFVYYVLLYIRGFDPPYCMIYYYFCLIFAFGANIFLNVLPCATYYVLLVLMADRAYYNSTYRASISSAGSLTSAVSYVAGSFPLAVV